MCCISGVLALSTNWTSAGIVAGVNLALGSIIFSASVHELRPRARRIGSRVPVVRTPPRPAIVKPKPTPRVASTAPLATPARSSSFRMALAPVFENWPLLWKEVYQYGTEWRPKSVKSALMVAVIFPTAFAAFLLLLLYAINPSLGTPQSAFALLGDFSRVIGAVLIVLLGSLTGLIVMRHAASSVTKEREKDTLTSLLVLPVDREEILNAKWLGGFAGWHLILLTMLGIIAFGLVTGGLSIPRGFVLACAIAAPLEFLASLGIWLSVSCRTSFRANLAAALALLLVAAGPMIVSNILEYESSIYVRSEERPGDLVLLGGMPPYAWVRCFYADDSASSGGDRELRAILWGALGYSVASWIIWRGACMRFRRMVK
jgi:ABC-type transport system involved in multi-copper enzyme maturation permease subunit